MVVVAVVTVAVVVPGSEVALVEPTMVRGAGGGGVERGESASGVTVGCTVE